MHGVDFDPYQGRRRANARGGGDRWLLSGVVLLALVALVVIVVNGPQRARSAPPGLPYPIGAVPSMVDASPTESPSFSPTPSPSPSPVASTRTARTATGAGTVPRRPSPTPVARTSAAPWSASSEAEAPDAWRWHAWVGPMAGASGGLGVFGLGQPTMGGLWLRVSVPRTGTYQLTVYYQNPDGGPRFAFIWVNHAAPQFARFAPTGNRAVQAVSLSTSLDAGGANTIGLGNPYGHAPDIDRIVLTQAS